MQQSRVVAWVQPDRFGEGLDSGFVLLALFRDLPHFIGLLCLGKCRTRRGVRFRGRRRFALGVAAGRFRLCVRKLSDGLFEEAQPARRAMSVSSSGPGRLRRDPKHLPRKRCRRQRTRSGEPLLQRSKTCGPCARRVYRRAGTPDRWTDGIVCFLTCARLPLPPRAPLVKHNPSGVHGVPSQKIYRSSQMRMRISCRCWSNISVQLPRRLGAAWSKLPGAIGGTGLWNITPG